MKRGSEVLAGVVLAGMGILFAVVALEVGIRILHLVPDRFWEPDPVLGVRLIPGHSGWWTQEDREFVVPVRINRHGLRDLEHEYAKPAGVYRILVLGDSFVEAMHVPLDATFPRLLEQRLNASGGAAHVEVVSAGVSGYGTAGEVLFFEREGKRYQPDLVLLAFYPGNDVKNNSPALEETLKPVYAADGTVQQVVSVGSPHAATGWRGALTQSAAYHYFRQLLLVRHPELAQRLIRRGWLRSDALRVAPEQDGIPREYGVYAAATPEWQEAWTHTEQLLGQLQQAATSAGARFAIAILSTRDQVYPQWWQEVLQQHPRMQGQQWDLAAPERRVVGWCEAHHVPCIGLSTAFRDAAGRTEALHFHHDGHWTVAGHRLAAVTLSEFLEQQRLVPLAQEGRSNEVH